jgi:hypothetical protein
VTAHRRSDSWALYTIASLPLDPRLSLLRHYPAMKLGVRESVGLFARWLAPVAEKITSSRSDGADWVVSAPPFYTLPAGANLLAWEVCRILGLRSVDLRYTLPFPRNVHDYSKSGVEDRIRNRRELHEGEWAPRPDDADFRDRAVLFINDINVTGTQQHFVERTLEPVGPASIDWLYIFQVDPHLGRSKPEIEYELNHLDLATFEDFAEIVAHADIDYTSRFVDRLLRYSAAEQETLFLSLDEERRNRLHQMIAREGLA